VPARLTHISRRERQILDVLFRLGRATVTEVRDRLPDPPSYSAVRALLRILEQKGHVRHLQDGPRYVFMPTVRRDSAKRSALRHLVNTFFEGSSAAVLASLFEMSARDLTDDELTQLKGLIDAARNSKE
jgi:predicted transcriptional regulator